MTNGMQKVVGITPKQAGDPQKPIDSMETVQSTIEQILAAMHSVVTKMKAMTIDITQLRGDIANFDDLRPPLHNYFSRTSPSSEQGSTPVEVVIGGRT